MVSRARARLPKQWWNPYKTGQISHTLFYHESWLTHVELPWAMTHTRWITMGHASHILNYNESCFTHVEWPWVMSHTQTSPNSGETHVQEVMCLSYVWHDSCVFHMYDMTHVSFICVTWLRSHYSYVWHDSCVMTYIRDMTHASSFICMTWLMRHHPYMWHNFWVRRTKQVVSHTHWILMSHVSETLNNLESCRRWIGLRTLSLVRTLSLLHAHSLLRDLLALKKNQTQTHTHTHTQSTLQSGEPH